MIKMMSKSKSLLAVGVLSSVISMQIMAQEAESAGIGLGLKASTLGPGLELDYRINKHFNIRLQANSYSYEDTFEEDGIDYSGEIDLSTYGVLADWRPFSGTFRFTGGVYSNNNELRGNALSDGTEVFEIGEQEYRGCQSAPLLVNTSVGLGSGSAGYLGLGWGNSDPSGWMFSFELGVLFSGSPEVELSVSGSAEAVGFEGSTFDVDGDSPQAREFQANVDREVANLEEEISDFEAYPVIALEIGYRF